MNEVPEAIGTRANEDPRSFSYYYVLTRLRASEISPIPAIAVLIFTLAGLFAAAPTMADVDEAVAYLASTQQVDGSWGEGANSLNTIFPSTAVAAKSLTLLDISAATAAGPHTPTASPT